MKTIGHVGIVVATSALLLLAAGCSDEEMETPHHPLQKAHAADESRPPAEAIREYTLAIESGKLSQRYLVEAHRGRGHAYWRNGNENKALADYTRAIELNPEDDWAYFTRGRAYMLCGQFNKAIADHTKAIELNPDFAGAYTGRGVAYMKKGDLDKALADNTRVIELEPEFSWGYRNRGSVYHMKGDPDKAIADYTKAIEVNPKDALAYSFRGLAYHNRGDDDKAIVDFTRAVELAPRDPYEQTFLYLARARVGKEGKTDLARFRKTLNDRRWMTSVVRMYLDEITPAQCLAAAASEDPKTDRERKCEAHFYVGQYLLLKGQTAAATIHFRKCLATGARTLVEYTAARGELRRLSGSNGG